MATYLYNPTLCDFSSVEPAPVCKPDDLEALLAG